MKRIKTKLFIIFLIIAAGFLYQYLTSINDTDILKAAQQQVEQKLSSKQKVAFSDVRIMKRNQYKEGERVRICGMYQVGDQSEVLPFVVSIDVRDGALSGHNQLLISDTAEMQASINQLCQTVNE